MKKTLKLRVTLVIAIFITLTLMTFSAAQDYETFGKVRKIIGKAEITLLGKDSAQKLEINQNVLLGDTIETFEESQVEIVFTDGKTIITIHDRTKVKLSTILNADNQNQSLISVFFGSISSFVNKLIGKSSYIIQTPNGTVSVRGTDFTVAVTDTADLLVSVNEGVVGYQKNEDESPVLLEKGNSCVVDLGRSPEIQTGLVESTSWISERNANIDNVAEEKSAQLNVMLPQVFLAIISVTKDLDDFMKNSIIMKILRGRLTPFDIIKLSSQRGNFSQFIYKQYYRLTLYDTIVLFAYRFFDYRSTYDASLIERRDEAWQKHLQISTNLDNLLKLYRAVLINPILRSIFL
ncbi:MAG TPA: FecR family protein [Exilispira sp.]|nr:FecR family protein [Exilispira sp.]